MNATSITLACLLALAALPQRLPAADEPGRVPDAPAQAVLPVVHALRTNDLVALGEMRAFATWSAALVAAADAPGPGRFITERIDEVLASVLAADAQDDLVARWLRWTGAGLVTAFATIPAPPPADLPPPGLLPPDVPPPGLPPAGPGGPGGGPRASAWTMVAGRGLASVLARGLESEQIAAGKRLLAAAQSWASGVDVTDADRARSAVAALIAAVTDLGATTVKDLAKLEQGELLARGNRALGHLKAATRAYGLDLDAVLDSLRIVELRDLQPGNGATAVTIAFSAFGSEQRFPLKVQRSAGGSWTVSADSQLGALLGDRLGVMDVMLALLGPPPGFPPGGPGGPDGRRDQRDAPPGFAPPPPGNGGF
jgi:hypothetical protein